MHFRPKTPEVQVIDVAFFIWTDGKIGGQERRYLRLANYMADFLNVKVAIFLQARALKLLLSHFEFSDNLQLVIFGSVNFDKTSPLSVIHELVSLRKALFSKWIINFHICTNPSYISALMPFIVYNKVRSLSQSMADYTFDKHTSGLKRRVIGLSINQFHFIDCLSAMTKSAFKKTFPYYSGTTAVAPNSFTDLSKVKKNRNKDLDIAFISRLVDGKGVDLLAQLLKTHIQDVNVLGFGYLSHTIDNRYLVNQDTDPFELLSRSKIFLSLQKGNNYPSQSLLEAMASGCAIIATDVGETREILNDENSILIEYDINGLCDAIDLLLSDPARRIKLAQNAMLTVNNHQTIEKYATYLLSKFVSVES